MYNTQPSGAQQDPPPQHDAVTVSAYYPQQTDQMGSMFSSMMPMIMMIMMMAIMMPMMKGVTGSSKG